MSVFSANVNVTDSNSHWDVTVTVHTTNLEHHFEYSYAKTGWTAAESGAEALLVVVDRVNRGAI